MVEEALISHQRRVDQALTDAAVARGHATRSEVVAWQRNEEALETFKDPAAEHAVRQAVHAYATRANKEAVTLRAALEALETEMALAQSSSMAAIRVIATKLIAQQDANVAIVLNELEAAESKLAQTESALMREERAHGTSIQLLAHELNRAEFAGELSIRALEEVVKRLRGENAKLLMEIDYLNLTMTSRVQKKVREIERAWTMEQAARKIEVRMMRNEMHDEMDGLRALHESAHKAQQAEMLERQKALTVAFNEALQAAKLQLMEAVKLRDAMIREGQERLRWEEEAHRMTESTLTGKTVDLEQQIARERKEHHAEMDTIRGQNWVLRDRVAVMYATLHGLPPPADYFNDNGSGPDLRRHASLARQRSSGQLTGL